MEVISANFFINTQRLKVWLSLEPLATQADRGSLSNMVNFDSVRWRKDSTHTGVDFANCECVDFDRER